MKLSGAERQRRYKERHPDRAKASKRRYYEGNADNIRRKRREYYQQNNERESERAGTYYRRNVDRLREYSRAYRASHIDSARANCSRWAKDNPDKRRAIDNARRVRLISNGGSFTTEEWQALCRKYGNICLCCRQRKPLVADHVVPVSKGGSGDIGNIQPLCSECNSAKRSKTTDYR